MENESRLKRLYWSAAATVIAAAIWLPSPLGELFFFPRHQLLQDKILFAVFFLVVVCILLFFFGKFVQQRYIALVLATTAIAGLACSLVILVLWEVHFSYSHGNWRNFSTIKSTTDMVAIFILMSATRGTFALAAFTALVYRYLPKLVDYIRSKYRSRQAAGATRGE